MSSFVTRKLLYFGKGGSDEIFIFPSQDPMTLEATGLAAGEVITFQHSKVPNPSTILSSTQQDFDHIDDHFDWRTAHWSTPNGKVYIRNSNVFYHQDVASLDDYEAKRQLFVYNKAQAEDMTATYTMHAPFPSKNTTLYGCKVRSAFGIIGWRVGFAPDGGPLQYEVAQTDGTDLALHDVWGGGSPLDGDSVEFGFSATEAWLSVNGTELWRGTLDPHLQGIGRMGLYQRSHLNFDPENPTPIFTLNSITPVNNQWEDLPNQQMDLDNPVMSIYSPILLRAIVPASTDYVSLILNRAT